MFTDSPVTPARLEALIDVLREVEERKIRKQELYDFFQPRSILDSQDIIKDTARAAKELNLIRDDFSLTFKNSSLLKTRDIVLKALEEEVLAKESVELYFALFYSFMLGLNKSAYEVKDVDDWVLRFKEQVFPNGFATNPFNKTKLSGLWRWLAYTGLGIYDSKDYFQAIPVRRMIRALPKIFNKKKKLSSDELMERISKNLPELDGGKIFKKANPNYQDDRQCTLGFSHALIALHDMKVIKLKCSVDSRGWSIGLAEPSSSDRIDYIELAQK